MSRRILQFGTSRFLQAHADLFVHEARQAGQDIGPITIVKTTQGGPRDGRVRAFGDSAGYLVRLRGLDKGRVVDETHRITSVARALDAHADWRELAEAFAEFDRHRVFQRRRQRLRDGSRKISKRRPGAGEVPRSFPAKLLALLSIRYERGAAPLLVLPCELVSGNGRVLRGLLSQLADLWGAGESFQRWLTQEVMICDTLVDRIVSEPIEPVGAVAEPYALWAIQREPGFTEPFQHPDVVYVDDLEPYLRLKLHILNLGHTFLAAIWRREGRPELESVREILADESVRTRLQALYDNEVLPGFAVRGLGLQARAYRDATLERFENPFLNHRLADIFENHAVKVQRRAEAFVSWVHSENPALPLPALEEFARTNYPPS